MNKNATFLVNSFTFLLCLAPAVAGVILSPPVHAETSQKSTYESGYFGGSAPPSDVSNMANMPSQQDMMDRFNANLCNLKSDPTPTMKRPSKDECERLAKKFAAPTQQKSQNSTMSGPVDPVEPVAPAMPEAPNTAQ